MRSGQPFLFSELESGAWQAAHGKYEIRREGLRVGERFTLFVNGQREVSLFAWLDQSPGPNPVYTWTLGATPKTGETTIGVATYAMLYDAFFKLIIRR